MTFLRTILVVAVLTTCSVRNVTAMTRDIKGNPTPFEIRLQEKSEALYEAYVSVKQAELSITSDTTEFTSEHRNALSQLRNTAATDEVRQLVLDTIQSVQNSVETDWDLLNAALRIGQFGITESSLETAAVDAINSYGEIPDMQLEVLGEAIRLLILRNIDEYLILLQSMLTEDYLGTAYSATSPRGSFVLSTIVSSLYECLPREKALAVFESLAARFGPPVRTDQVTFADQLADALDRSIELLRTEIEAQNN